MSDVTDNTARQRFELDVGVGEPAFIAYERDGGTITLVHTIVPEAASGQGAGSRLVRGALAIIRVQGLRVVPQCSFVAAYMERHPEERDLLA
ncbi:GNAT family N-acetyltransferase [Roseomonas populi]|uniref:N-acetyltransferase n=1 Tax=Roseomonas populi TaxID=3121582 RepID=A0ABT1X051_9PROT|nr:GNAT family N-acetyltransferase [Roseomonas pecuniae]MCR0981478.1 N-acetyltransferase [Roseomonas pecuniae]